MGGKVKVAVISHQMGTISIGRSPMTKRKRFFGGQGAWWWDLNGTHRRLFDARTEMSRVNDRKALEYLWCQDTLTDVEHPNNIRQANGS